jgi:hypothetical protein
MALRRMGPMAVIILGGLATSTLLNLFLLPPLYERYGRSSKDPGHGPSANAERVQAEELAAT